MCLSYLWPIYLVSHFSFITNRSAFSDFPRDILHCVDSKIHSKAWGREEKRQSLNPNKAHVDLQHGTMLRTCLFSSWQSCTGMWSVRGRPWPLIENHIQRTSSMSSTWSKSSRLSDPPPLNFARGGGGAWFEANKISGHLPACIFVNSPNILLLLPL